MIGNRIFYVSTSKKALESKDWETFIDEAVCEDLPNGVELVDEFYDNFEPEMIEGNDFFNIDGFDSEPDVPVNEDVSIQNLSFILPPNDGSDYRVSIDVLPDDWEIAGLEEAFSEPNEEVE